MSDTPKRFEDWEKVECNDCSHYWDSSCDGASKGSSIACNSYLAKRGVVIPERLKVLENRLERLIVWCVISNSIFIVFIIEYLLGWI